MEQAAIFCLPLITWIVTSPASQDSASSTLNGQNEETAEPESQSAPAPHGPTLTAVCTRPSYFFVFRCWARRLLRFWFSLHNSWQPTDVRAVVLGRIRPSHFRVFQCIPLYSRVFPCISMYPPVGVHRNTRDYMEISLFSSPSWFRTWRRSRAVCRCSLSCRPTMHRRPSRSSEAANDDPSATMNSQTVVHKPRSKASLRRTTPIVSPPRHGPNNHNPWSSRASPPLPSLPSPPLPSPPRLHSPNSGLCTA